MEVLFVSLVILFGFGLILADILFIPGGIIGTIGTLFIIGALVAANKILGRETAFALAGGTIILGGFLTWISVKFKLWRLFVTEGKESRERGFLSHKTSPEKVIGQSGVVTTDLRPAGTVTISGKKFDAVTEGGFIETGVAVRVVSATSGQIKVRVEET